jgi:hypothetical protein
MPLLLLQLPVLLLALLLPLLSTTLLSLLPPDAWSRAVALCPAVFYSSGRLAYVSREASTGIAVTALVGI